MKYAQERKQFGKPIADFQGMQFQIAQMATEIEAARLLVYNAARMKDAGMNFLKEAAMAKLFASQVAERVTSLCDRDLRRLRLHQRLSGRKVLARLRRSARSTKAPVNMQLQTIAKLVMGK